MFYVGFGFIMGILSIVTWSIREVLNAKAEFWKSKDREIVCRLIDNEVFTSIQSKRLELKYKRDLVEYHKFKMTHPVVKEVDIHTKD